MTKQQNPALNGRIISTFFYYLVPSLIGLIAITTASLVDGIFIGHAVGSNGLAAITLLLPYFTVLVAIALMLAIGGSVSAGKLMAEGKEKQASDLFSQSLIAAVVINLVLAILSFVFEAQVYQLLKVPVSLYPQIDAYFSVIRWVQVIQLFTMVLYYFVRADAHPFLATSALVTGAILNIVLDAYFILYLDMGLAGAAYATAIAQTLQLALLLSYFSSKNKSLFFKWQQQNWTLFYRAVYNGISEFINELSAGLIFITLNWLLMERLGIAGIAAFTVINYFIFLSIMLCYGIADTLHLLVSQNLGAKQFKRIKHFLLTSILSTILIAISVLGILLLWQQQAISYFLKPEEQDIAILCGQLLSLVWPLFLVNGCNIILSCYLTAMHQAKSSAIIALARGLILPISLLLLLFYVFPQWQVKADISPQWTFLIALPLSEWITLFLAISLFIPHFPSQKNVKAKGEK